MACYLLHFWVSRFTAAAAANMYCRKLFIYFTFQDLQDIKPNFCSHKNITSIKINCETYSAQKCTKHFFNAVFNNDSYLCLYMLCYFEHDNITISLILIDSAWLFEVWELLKRSPLSHRVHTVLHVLCMCCSCCFWVHCLSNRNHCKVCLLRFCTSYFRIYLDPEIDKMILCIWQPVLGSLIAYDPQVVVAAQWWPNYSYLDMQRLVKVCNKSVIGWLNTEHLTNQFVCLSVSKSPCTIEQVKK